MLTLMTKHGEQLPRNGRILDAPLSLSLSSLFLSQCSNLIRHPREEAHRECERSMRQFAPFLGTLDRRAVVSRNDTHPGRPRPPPLFSSVSKRAPREISRGNARSAVSSGEDSPRAASTEYILARIVPTCVHTFSFIKSPFSRLKVVPSIKLPILLQIRSPLSPIRP